MLMRCRDCRYFQPNPPADRPGDLAAALNGGSNGGECHRRPPAFGPLVEAIGTRTLGEFPRILAADWCGEFSPRET